jgi:ADP-ribose pyrophosphatase YjhB (NUDIX family)
MTSKGLTGLRVSVNAFILDSAGRVLLQRRSDNGNWNMPGGGLELGESLSAALHREVLEETGLEVAIERYVGVYSDPATTSLTYPDGRVVHYVAHVLVCRVTGGVLQQNHESLELGWFDPNNLPEPFSAQHRPRIADALQNLEAAFFR